MNGWTNFVIAMNTASHHNWRSFSDKNYFVITVIVAMHFIELLNNLLSGAPFHLMRLRV
jgi:hypothetical protein